MKVENCSSVSRLPACILSNRLVSYFPKKEAQRYCSERKNQAFCRGSLEVSLINVTRKPSCFLIVPRNWCSLSKKQAAIKERARVLFISEEFCARCPASCARCIVSCVRYETSCLLCFASSTRCEVF